MSMMNLKASTRYPDDDGKTVSAPSKSGRSELTGDLGDFSLTDILQILSLTRKTGTLVVEASTCIGKVVVEDGKITYASLRPGESFAERLVRENRVSLETLDRLHGVGEQRDGVWTLHELLTESGVLTAHDLEHIARRHFQDIIGELISLKEGRFGIDLNQTMLPEPLSEVKLGDGVDVGEILLAAASERDEEERVIQLDESETPSWVDNLKLDSWQMDDEPAYSRQQTASNVIPFNGQIANRVRLTPEERSLLLLSLLTEMRSHTEEIEIILLIMRYASEVASRGVIFFVREDEVCGFGQFEIDSLSAMQTADELVRDICIPVGEGSIFDTVLWTGQPFIGTLPQNHHHREMLKKIGGNESEISAFALPLFRNNEAIIVFYGDNYPDFSEISGFDGLVALVTQASLVLEKLELERRLNKQPF